MYEVYAYYAGTGWELYCVCNNADLAIRTAKKRRCAEVYDKTGDRTIHKHGTAECEEHDAWLTRTPR